MDIVQVRKSTRDIAHIKNINQGYSTLRTRMTNKGYGGDYK